MNHDTFNSRFNVFDSILPFGLLKDTPGSLLPEVWFGTCLIKRSNSVNWLVSGEVEEALEELDVDGVWL